MPLRFTFHVASSTHQGCVRAINQDAILVREGLWAVADGVGGLSKGEVASQTVVDALAELGTGSSRTTVSKRIFDANFAIFARAEPKGMAATVAVLGIT